MAVSKKYNKETQTWEEVDFGGSTGASAYEVAVKNGFVGTEKEWLESLKGEIPKLAPLIFSNDEKQDSYDGTKELIVDLSTFLSTMLLNPYSKEFTSPIALNYNDMKLYSEDVHKQDIDDIKKALGNYIDDVNNLIGGV